MRELNFIFFRLASDLRLERCERERGRRLGTKVRWIWKMRPDIDIRAR